MMSISWECSLKFGCRKTDKSTFQQVNLPGGALVLLPPLASEDVNELPKEYMFGGFILKVFI